MELNEVLIKCGFKNTGVNEWKRCNDAVTPTKDGGLWLTHYTPNTHRFLWDTFYKNVEDFANTHEYWMM